MRPNPSPTYERLVGKQLGGVRRKSAPHAVPHIRNSTC